MKILVTGGSGFIGTNLIKALQNEGHVVVSFALEENPNIEVETIIGDITKSNFDFVRDEKPEVIFHLAALSNHQMTTDRNYAIEVNVRPLEKLLSVSSSSALKKFIFMSTSTVYDDNNQIPIKEDGKLNPQKNNYIYTKVEGEKIVESFRQKGLKALTYRLANTFGPYQPWQKFPTLVPQIFAQAILEGHIHTLNRSSVRDWIYIEDAVGALIAGMKSDFSGTANLASGKGTSVGDIVDLVCGLTFVSASTDNKEGSGPNQIICDNTILKEKIGYDPKISLEAGLNKTYAYYKQVIKNEN